MELARHAIRFKDLKKYPEKCKTERFLRKAYSIIIKLQAIK